MNYGGFHLLSSSQKESMSIEECACWGSLLARPRSHTHCIEHPVGEESVTWPYLIARETGECIVAGRMWLCHFWKEGRVDLGG